MLRNFIFLGGEGICAFGLVHPQWPCTRLDRMCLSPEFQSMDAKSNTRFERFARCISFAGSRPEWHLRLAGACHGTFWSLKETFAGSFMLETFGNSSPSFGNAFKPRLESWINPFDQNASAGSSRTRCLAKKQLRWTWSVFLQPTRKNLQVWLSVPALASVLVAFVPNAASDEASWLLLSFLPLAFSAIGFWSFSFNFSRTCVCGKSENWFTCVNSLTHGCMAINSASGFTFHKSWCNDATMWWMMNQSTHLSAPQIHCSSVAYRPSRCFTHSR